MGEPDADLCPLARSTLQDDIAAVRVDDVPADGESQAGAPALAGGEERLEYPRQVARLDAGAGIRYFDQGARLPFGDVIARGHDQSAPFRHRSDGVLKDNPQD